MPRLRLALQVLGAVQLAAAALLVDDEAASFIQRHAWASNTSGLLAGTAEGELKPPPRKPRARKPAPRKRAATSKNVVKKRKKVKSSLPEWKQWLQEMGLQRKAEGDAGQPLYVFLVRQFTKRQKKVKGEKKPTKWFGESENRWEIGAIMFCSQKVQGRCTKTRSQNMHTNSIPLIAEYEREFETKKFNGDIVFSTHSGISPRHKALAGMEAGGRGVYKSSEYFAETYLKPLLKNPVTVKRMFFFTCNSGTRFNYKTALTHLEDHNDFSPAIREKLNSGASYIDRLLVHVAKFVKAGMNNGVLPTIYGSNGFTFNYIGMGRSEMRVHQIYDKEDDEECKLAATWMNQGDGKAQKAPCDRLDYAYAYVSPAHWSELEPNIEKFAYPHGRVIKDMPTYPNDAEVAGFLKARLPNDDNVLDPEEGVGGRRADEDGLVNNIEPGSTASDAGSEDEDDSDEDEDEDEDDDEESDDSDEDDDEDSDEDDDGDSDEDDDEDSDEDDDEDSDEDSDASMLQVNASRAASGPGAEQANSVSGNGLFWQELQMDLNATALDSYLVSGLQSFSEERKLRAFRAATRVLQNQSLTGDERRNQLLQEVGGEAFPEVLNTIMQSPRLQMPRQWWEDVMVDSNGKGMEMHCLEKKLRIPLALFQAVMAVISVSKCDSKLMCTADSFDVLSGLGSTAAQLQYAGSKCSTRQDDVACSGAVTEMSSALFGIVNSASALAHQCGKKYKSSPARAQGSCAVTAAFSGGWAILAVLSIVKTAMEPRNVDNSMDLIFATSFFSKMILETLELCDDSGSLCGKEVAEFMAYMANKGGAMKRAKQYCKVSELCVGVNKDAEPEDEEDNDRDGINDLADPDNDNDGIPNLDDLDQDGDEIPDKIDPDDDNDGVKDGVDQPGMSYWRKFFCAKVKEKEAPVNLGPVIDVPGLT